MIKIYLAGPILGMTTHQAKNWRDYAIMRLTSLSHINNIENGKRKFDCLDPPRRQCTKENPMTNNEIVLLDKKDVEDADIIIVNYNAPSIGTAMEVLYAHQLNKIILAFTNLPEESQSPWMQYHCTRIFKSVDETILYIKKYF